MQMNKVLSALSCLFLFFNGIGKVYFANLSFLVTISKSIADDCSGLRSDQILSVSDLELSALKDFFGATNGSEWIWLPPEYGPRWSFSSDQS
jgi:hypothetical protein